MSDRERLLDELRPVAVAIAYRMLGSVSDAEDVVQEALLRVHQALDGRADRSSTTGKCRTIRKSGQRAEDRETAAACRLLVHRTGIGRGLATSRHLLLRSDAALADRADRPATHGKRGEKLYVYNQSMPITTFSSEGTRP